MGLTLSLFAKNRNKERDVDEMERPSALLESGISYDELFAENTRLRKILDIKSERPSLKRFIVSEVISIKPFVFPAEIIINKGYEEGLQENMVVLSKDRYLIGRICSVRKTTSSVMTIFNSKSRVSVIVDNTRDIGVLEGGDVPQLFLRYIPVESRVKKGDKIITSGFSDFFPKGIEVGEIDKIDKIPDTLFLKIQVKPYSGFSGIDEVFAGE